MGKPSITLYFDTVSPFAYLAFYALENFDIFKNVDKEYIPIFLGGLMKACNNTPPIQVKNKDKWIDKERLRWTTLFNIPMNKDMPEGFPPLTLTTQRALVALSKKHPESLIPALNGMYKAMWVDHEKIQNPAVIQAVLSTVVGNVSALEILNAAQTQEVKSALNKNTEKAFADGAFGLPWFVVINSQGKTEGFWGFDHIGQVIDFLGLERPDKAGWKAML